MKNYLGIFNNYFDPGCFVLDSSVFVCYTCNILGGAPRVGAISSRGLLSLALAGNAAKAIPAMA
jgi:hypothetical protein